MAKMNIDLSGKTLKVLTLDEKIKKGDFCRPLYESPCRDGGFSTTYKPEGWQGTRWQPVKNELSGWMNRTQREYLHFGLGEKQKMSIDKHDYKEYEIVRVVEVV